MSGLIYKIVAADVWAAAKNEGVFAEDNTIELQDPSDFGLRVDSRKGDGRKVIEVIEGTNASAMGLRKDDVIQTIEISRDGGREWRRVFEAWYRREP